MIDHRSCFIEMARLQRERDDLRRYAQRLRDLGTLAIGYIQGHGSPAFLPDLRAAVAGEIEPQDPLADAAEDAAFVDAIRRMEDAEAREDAAERKR